MNGRVVDAVQVYDIGTPAHLDRPGRIRLPHILVHELKVIVPLALVSDGPENDRGVALVAFDHLPQGREKSFFPPSVPTASSNAPYRGVLGLDIEPEPVTEIVKVSGPRKMRRAYVVHVPRLHRPQIPLFDFLRNVQATQRVVGQEVDASQLHPLPVDVHLVALDFHLPEPDRSLYRLHLDPTDDQRCPQDIEKWRLGRPLSRAVDPQGRRVPPAAIGELDLTVLRYPAAVDVAHGDRYCSFLSREHAADAYRQSRVPIVRIEIRLVMEGR